MTTTTPTTTTNRPTDVTPAERAITVTQYSRRGIFMIWAAAALPMGALSWIVAPAIAHGSGIESMMRPLLACLTAGLVWQFVLAMALVGYEQRSLRWTRIKEALWLRKPRSPKTGRVGGRLWLVVIPLVIGTAIEGMIGLPEPASRAFGDFLSSDAGKAFFHGAWGVYALFLVMGLFNTVLGEELLFRGVLLPRMQGAFGDRDWIANGLLFTAYHLHVPWRIPGTLLDTFLVVYPTKRYRSAWIGIAVHSAQTVVLGLMVLTVVV
jgi:membrane protease YdiL (CAAX protease family)